MLDLSRLIESALDENEATLRKAAMGTIAAMRPDAKFSELLESDAAMTIRSLSLRELADALRPIAPKSASKAAVNGRRHHIEVSEATLNAAQELESDVSREERLFREILEILAAGPQTIGQLGKRLDVDTSELRGYLQWMLHEQKIARIGRARATRYQLPG